MGILGLSALIFWHSQITCLKESVRALEMLFTRFLAQHRDSKACFLQLPYSAFQGRFESFVRASCCGEFGVLIAPSDFPLS